MKDWYRSISEAEYAAENRIKFIPCLMESEFRAQSWLGIIKGANVHVDFSSADLFDDSFTELIRQITYVEGKLSLRPRSFLVDFTLNKMITFSRF
jgi:hypothetical protein